MAMTEVRSLNEALHTVSGALDYAVGRARAVSRVQPPDPTAIHMPISIPQLQETLVIVGNVLTDLSVVAMNVATGLASAYGADPRYQGTGVEAAVDHAVDTFNRLSVRLLGRRITAPPGNALDGLLRQLRAYARQRNTGKKG